MTSTTATKEGHQKWDPLTEDIPKTHDIEPVAQRLCWVKYETDDDDHCDYWWPAILHYELGDYLEHNDGKVDDASKTQIALKVMENFETRVMIAQYLGLGLKYKVLREGTDDYYRYWDMLQHGISTLAVPKTFAKHLDLYLDFMKGLDEAYSLLQNDGEKSDIQVKRGKELLELFQKETSENENDNADVKVAENNETEQEKADDSPAAADASETATTASPKEETAKVPTDEGDDDATEEEDAAKSNVQSSSATVVSQESASVGASHDVDLSTIKYVDLPYTDADFDDVCGILIMENKWTRRLVDGQILYSPPLGKKKKDQRIYLDESQLQEFLKLKCQWKGPKASNTPGRSKNSRSSRDRSTPKWEDKNSSPTKEAKTEKANSVKKEKKADNGKQQPPPSVGKRKLEEDLAPLSTTKKTKVDAPKPAASSSTAKKAKKKKPAAKTPPPSSRPTPARSSRRTITPVKVKAEEEDDFYTFNNLMAFNRACLNWLYLRGGALHAYKYVVGDGAGPSGKAGVDFFHEEADMIEYCKQQNYKEKFAQEYKDWTDKGQRSKYGFDHPKDWSFATPMKK